MTSATTSRSFAPAPIESQPRLHRPGREIQRFDQLRDLPLGLPAEARAEVAGLLNGILANIRILRDLYKKTHWQVRGETFYQLHLLTDKHAEEQDALIDALGERIQTLGAMAVGDPRHVAELASIPRPPDGAEAIPDALSRLAQAHETILVASRDAAHRAEECGDDGTNDLLVSEVVRVNELQVWFTAEHLVPTPVVS